MSFTEAEVLKAVSEVNTTEGVSLNNTLALSLITKFDGMKERNPFRLAMRYALNETYICEKGERSLYAKVIGKVYGRHGGRQAARKRSAGIPPKLKKSPNKEPEIITEEENGQFAFQV